MLFTSRTKLIVKEFRLKKSISYVWGMKRSGDKYRNKLKRGEFIFLEDGFIHSYGLKKNNIPFGICFDPDGIYYDENRKSKLYSLVTKKLNKNNLLRSKNIIKLWKEFSISKYNFPDFISPPEDKYILLIDQTFGDLSIFYGGANSNSFISMFNFACNNWPKHKIVLKIHPDVVNSRKKGYLDNLHNKGKNVILISEKGQINKLIEKSSAVCVVTSQVGFEALIYGKEVHVFGRPFYSGMGLTIDHNNSNHFKKKIDVSIEQLVFALFTKYQIYRDPRTKSYCEVEKIMEFINKNREISKFFQNKKIGLNLTPWKSRQINRFIYGANGTRIDSKKRFKSKMKNIVVWGKSTQSDKYKVEVNEFISVEDGFIRSVGLGSALYPPLSLLFDKKGIHYDANATNHLEELLQNRILNKVELKRSKKLINLIIKSKMSKYNLKIKNELKLPEEASKKKIIAILGQVETDNSIIYGVPGNAIKKTNYALVKQVKKDNPDAFIVYKPHPDLESGLRKKGLEESNINKIADYIANKTSLDDIFEKVDKVAVFTSLGGFEALIRGLSVTTYGLPFYAGWGLTEDKIKKHNCLKRRTRKLSLEELIFISLIEYPFYYSLRFDCFTEIENIIDEIHFQKLKKENLEQFVFKYWGLIKDLILRN